MSIEIKNPHYHNMSFGEIDRIREEIIARKLNIYVNTTQLYLYLNQMSKGYRFILTWTQNLWIISIIAAIIFLFLNWKISILLFLVFLLAGTYSRKLALKFIKKQSIEDRVFLKFALVTELIKTSQKTQPLIDAIYK